jgi:pyrroloquinoline quinone biosynthesis protein B
VRLIVLGSAAGGGLPQWNCDCANCSAARRGRLAQRTQCSLAVSADGERWALLNASPDLRAQINATAALAPGPGRRSPVAAVVLTSADIDCIAGLLTLREGHSFELFAAAPVLELIAHDRVFRCLPPERVPRRRIRPGEAFEVAGLRILPIAAPG